MKWKTQVVAVVVGSCVWGIALPFFWREGTRPPKPAVGVAVAPPRAEAEEPKGWVRGAGQPTTASIRPDVVQPGDSAVDPDVVLAKAIVERNARWLFVTDQGGNFVLNEQRQRVLTPIGQRYAFHVVAAERAGVKGAENQHAYAVRMLKTEMVEEAVAQAEANSPPSVPAVANGVAQKIPNLGGRKIAVLADSISCRQLARFVLKSNKIYSETPLRDADLVLVVVRSLLPLPLRYRYDGLGELKTDSKRQLNLIGSLGHVYVYAFDDNLEMREAFHSHLSWETWEVLMGE